MASSFHRTDRRMLVAVGSTLCAIIVWWAWMWMPPPQIGTDRDVFNTVDALFTALTSRDESRLDDCESRLITAADEGRLPTRPARFLDGVIQQARDGKWEPAARRLYDFMYGQHGK